MSIGDALARVAETFSRLVVQNLQLLRSEVETEVRVVGDRGRTIGRRLLRATPFLIAGIAVASLSLGELLGLWLEPWLGRGSGPLCTLLFGLTEAAIAAAWLRGTLDSRTRSGRPAGGAGSARGLASVHFESTGPESDSRRPSWDGPGYSFPAASPVTIVQEKTHGSMG